MNPNSAFNYLPNGSIPEAAIRLSTVLIL